MQNPNLKETFLYALIISIAFSALMGIWAILSGEFGEFQSRVLMTTLTIVGTSILGLACGAFWESPKSANSALKIVPFVGMILAVVAAILTLALIWKISSSQNEIVLKTLAVSGIFAATLAQLSLLSLANLAQKFLWTLTAVYIVALILASIASVLIIIEPSSESDFVMRFMGALGVIDAALTVLIPVFHRLSRDDFAEKRTEIGKIDAEISKLKDELSRLEQQREKLLTREH